ncbi:hypothetical protein WL22_34070 [Burkholderia ubonensis]|uniref:Uncharacterized protein n=2 Tax=Burkholderia cepacia complex TaxID=87882 RepID=A0A1B4Q3T8_BURCE|nr:hypothetical protein WT26_34585 [Burkholderia cepacia]AOK27602.1 hypothetical protein WK67_34380 [Burkholderia ubonensis]KVZ81973.1 hypothetical protein WL22_34070 [Burkholderia ubonensis]
MRGTRGTRNRIDAGIGPARRRNGRPGTLLAGPSTPRATRPLSSNGFARASAKPKCMPRTREKSAMT